MGIIAGRDLRMMEESGRIVRKALDEMKAVIEIGVSTIEIESVGRKVIEAEELPLLFWDTMDFQHLPVSP